MKAGANHALGIIETAGRAPLIEAVDSAIKAAAVTLKMAYFVGGGLNTVTLVGDVGAMRAALDAAKATIDRMGAVGQTLLIPRLAEDVWPLIMDQTNGRDPSPPRNPPGPVTSKASATIGAAVQDKLPGQEAPPVPEPPKAEPATLVSSPTEEETGDKKEGDVKSRALEETFFSDEASRSGERVSTPKKKSGDGSSGKKPRGGNPKSKG